MQNIGIYVNHERDQALTATKAVAEVLLSRGKNVLIDEVYRNKLAVNASFVSHDMMFKTAELVITLGGDGTILRIIEDAATHNIPVIGINLGHLGFLTQAEKNDTEVFDKILNGEFSVNNAMMLEAKVNRDGHELLKQTVLNDIIFKGVNSKMISLEVEIDGTVTNRYLADGIIVATSTGSTAYSLSCGGPIVHQALDCIILTPICPHTLKSRCIIIPPDSSIVLRFDPSYCESANLKADGNHVASLNPGDFIEITQSSKRAPLIALNDRNYFDVIRTKLSD